MQDQAGNYIFNIDGQSYRVMKMDYFQQCRIAGLFEKLNKPFAQDGIEAQRELFGIIQWEVEPNNFVFLDDFNLKKLLARLDGGSLKNGMALLETITTELMGNFTDTGAAEARSNSDQPPVENSNPANTKTESPLTQIYEQSRRIS